MSREEVMRELGNVVDPEIGLPVTEMNLIDSVEISGGDVTVKYHLTMPFCPPFFALAIGQDIRRRVSQIQGVAKVTAILTEHQMAEEINRRVNSQG